MGTHVSFFLGVISPMNWGLKPSFFMVLGSKGSKVFGQITFATSRTETDPKIVLWWDVKTLKKKWDIPGQIITTNPPPGTVTLNCGDCFREFQPSIPETFRFRKYT